MLQRKHLSIIIYFWKQKETYLKKTIQEIVYKVRFKELSNFISSLRGMKALFLINS